MNYTNRSNVDLIPVQARVSGRVSDPAVPLRRFKGHDEGYALYALTAATHPILGVPSAASLLSSERGPRESCPLAQNRNFSRNNRCVYKFRV